METRMSHVAFPGRDYMKCAQIAFLIQPICFVQPQPKANVFSTFPNIILMSRTKQTARAATAAGKAPRQCEGPATSASGASRKGSSEGSFKKELVCLFIRLKSMKGWLSNNLVVSNSRQAQ